jgi:hypothetical protein
MTHTYITTIEQPTLHYLTRSVRRRAATSKRASVYRADQLSDGLKLAGNGVVGSDLQHSARMLRSFDWLTRTSRILYATVQDGAGMDEGSHSNIRMSAFRIPVPAL